MELEYQIMQRSQSTLYRCSLSKDGAIESIINDIVFTLDLSKEKLMTNTRVMPYPAARRVISYALREKLGMTFLNIGKVLNRDHSTIVHNVEWIKNRMDILEHYPEELKALNYVLKGFDD